MKKKIVVLLSVVSIVSVVDIVGTIIWFRAIVEDDQIIQPKPAQVAVILMAGFDQEFKALGKQTLRSVIYGANLYRQGLVKNIFCVGGARPAKNVFGSELMKQALIDRGVPSEKIVTENQSYDSKSNWRIAHQMIKANHWTKVVIVSSPLHIHRLKRIVFDKRAADIDVSFSTYSYRLWKNSLLKITPIEIWRSVHYEWISYLLHYLLPESLYQYILKIIRHQSISVRESLENLILLI
jgi:vancomycin permeability regulator SanA